MELPFEPSVFASRGSNQSTAKPTPARSVLQSEPCVYHTQPPATVTFTALLFVAAQIDAGIVVFVVVHVSVLRPWATSIAGLTGPPFRGDFASDPSGASAAAATTQINAVATARKPKRSFRCPRARSNARFISPLSPFRSSKTPRSPLRRCDPALKR